MFRWFGNRKAGPATVPLERYLHRRPVRLTLWTVGGVLLFVSLSLADHRGWLSGPAGDLAKYDGHRFLVSHVVDGDTLDVAEPDNGRPTTRIRFWGIDAPEMEHPGMPGPPGLKSRQPFALEATEMVRAKALNQRVELHLETQRLRDKFGRLLAYIELPDGTLLNEDLLAAGFARADNRWTHRRLDRFILIEEQARHDHVGLWRGPLKRAAPNDSAQTQPDDENDD